MRTLVQKWTSQLDKHCNHDRVSAFPLLSSFIPSSPSMEPHSSDEIIKDVFNWLFDFSTPFLVMWIHDENVTQTILVAQVVAGILAKRGKLSASFFSGLEGIVNARHVIPTLAYQLTQSRPEVRTHVGQAVAQDNSIFNLEIETQLGKLLCDPLLAVSESGNMKPQGIPDVFLVHGLENYNGDYFQSPFLQEFVDVLHSIRTTNTPHRLLIIGRHTSFLQSCTSKPNMRQTILERPMTTSFWFGREEEIGFWNKEAQRREAGLKRREEGLRRKEQEFRVIGARLDTEEEDIKRRKCALQLDEEKLKTREDTLEDVLKRREDEVSRREDEVSRREDEEVTVANGVFGTLIRHIHGDKMICHHKELQSTPLIVPQLIYQTPMTTKIQEELDFGRVLGDTSAASAAIFEKMKELQEKHEKEMEELTKVVEEAENENDKQLRAEPEIDHRELIEKPASEIRSHAENNATDCLSKTMELEYEQANTPIDECSSEQSRERLQVDSDTMYQASCYPLSFQDHHTYSIGFGYYWDSNAAF